jgi:hypothetical protein
MTPKCVMERRHKTATVGSRGRRRRVSERGAQLIEKQKARYIYGLYERQFKRFYGIAAKQPGITGDNLKVMLERRLITLFTAWVCGFPSPGASAGSARTYYGQRPQAKCAFRFNRQ